MRPLALSLALAASFGFIHVDADAKTFNVSPGVSIQKTIDNAEPGDRIQVYAGVYTEALEITTDNIALVGVPFQGERPVISGKLEVEVFDRAIAIGSDGVTVEGFVIRDFTEAAVVADNVSDVTVRDLVLHRTGSHGLRLDDIENAVLDGIVASENVNVGLHVTESTNVAITNGRFTLSHIGILILECFDTLIENTDVYSNVVGILATSQPNPPKQEGDHLSIRYSRVVGNAGTAPELNENETAIPIRVPGGVGIAIVGSDNTSISDSVLHSNGSCAIATYAYPGAAAPEGEAAAESTSGIPDHTFTRNNTFVNNGGAPGDDFGAIFEGVAPGDLYWDGTGIRNQWQESTKLKTHPEGLVAEQGGVHTDVMHFL